MVLAAEFDPGNPGSVRVKINFSENIYIQSVPGGVGVCGYSGGDCGYPRGGGPVLWGDSGYPGGASARAGCARGSGDTPRARELDLEAEPARGREQPRGREALPWG